MAQSTAICHFVFKMPIYFMMINKNPFS
uniref:Uncharacterized protein n=1 Tax=Rhizophora mucronata TaxID=61149 RepID=A0A2P2QCK8_RHIMU